MEWSIYVESVATEKYELPTHSLHANGRHVNCFRDVFTSLFALKINYNYLLYTYTGCPKNPLFELVIYSDLIVFQMRSVSDLMYT